MICLGIISGYNVNIPTEEAQNGATGKGNECACCCDDYDIKDRSFINKSTGRYYFEIHHVISLGNNYELDDENNLVKLCPICHDSLKRGAGLKKDQLVNIDKILKNSPNALDFAHHFFDEDDYGKILELIWERLR